MTLFILNRTTYTILYYIIAAIILVFLCLPTACEKDEPTASVSFKPPGIYTGTYYVLRDWQSPSYEDTSLAYVDFDFKGDGTFTMIKDSSASWSEFRLCNVYGTYTFTGAELRLTITNPHPNVETCDTSMAPKGNLAYRSVGNTLVFWLGNSVDSVYRKIELAGR